jgi:amino acid adenylation domain-containing protein
MFSSSAKWSSVVQGVEAQASKDPDLIAVQHGDQCLSYGALNRRANHLAFFLQAMGVKTDVPVAICLPRSLDMVVAVLGTLKAGGAYLPLDPQVPADRLAYMLAESRPAMVLGHAQTMARLPGVEVPVALLDADGSRSERADAPPLSTGPDDLSYIIYTSGSTGRPKGVAMVQGALLNLLTWQVAHSSCGAGDKTLQLAPLSFDVSFQEIFSTWLSGGTLVLTDEETRTDPARMLEHLVTTGIRRLFLPYVALQQLAEVAVRRGPVPTELREVVTAGEALRITQQIAELFRKLPQCRLQNQYGPSETHVVTAYALTGPPAEWPVLPPIGRALPNVNLAILDTQGRPVAPGEEGELYVGGAALARGYLGQPELTQQRFVVDDNGSRLYRTGDWVKQRPDGELEFLGRTDDQVKLRGYRIELGEIEVALSQHPDVAQAAVAVREDQPGHKRLVAYLVAADGRSPRAAEVRRQLQTRLPEYMVPAAFVFLPALPRTPSGKIDRRSLPQPGRQRPALDVGFEAARGHEEETIAQIWARLLDIDQVGALDSFFDLGGTSLLAVQSVLALREALGRDVAVVKVFQYPTPRALAGYLAHGTAKPAPERAIDRGRQAVAIIGMAGRFPGARNLDELWRNLRAGRETVSFFAPDEVDPSQNASQPGYVAARGVLEDADKFDSGFFGEPPRLADITDPQQRVFLEVAWHALEDAGVVPGQTQTSVGVFAGVGNNTYQWANLTNRPDVTEPVGSFQVMLGNEKDYVATRVAHKLDLHGPALSIHTGCSTSLVAVCTAVRSLLDGECDVALAGGASVTCPQKIGHVYSEGGMLSSDGHTRSFDARGTGTVFSDGAGAVVCKRLDDALADGDRIYAVIHGVAVNNDGADKASFTAPSVNGQVRVIRAALAMAGFHPESISYIETHGTATPLGDPIEVEALIEAFRAHTEKQGFCALGSVKSNIGHLTAAAGVAGLIKTALALHHRELPASLHFQTPNPHIDFQRTPFKVQTTMEPWTPPQGQPRRAGVSSFGVGGTNAHVVLQEAPTPTPTETGLPVQLLLLSAKQATTLDAATVNLQRHLTENPELDLADVAFTLQTRRAVLAHRRFVVCSDRAEASQALQHLSPDNSQTRKLDRAHPEVVFLFPGQGSQHPDMARALYQDEPVVRGAIDACAEMLSAHMQRDLRALLFPQPGDRDEAARQLQRTEYAQPALFTVEYALAELWRSWGVAPSAMLGHSVGEYVAACLAGVFSLADALALVAERGRLVQAQPGGSMLSVRATAHEIEPRLKAGLDLAASNGPRLCVVSGPTPQVAELQRTLESEGIPCRLLLTSHAFHSSMMDPVMAPFAARVASVSRSAPRLPFVSSTTGIWITPAQACDPEYWARHLRQPVRFAEGICTLWTDPDRVLLEVGPRTAATTMARASMNDPARQCAVATLGGDPGRQADWGSVLRAMGRLWVHGVDIDWAAVHAGTRRRVVSLPPYPFERRRHWVEPGVLHASAIAPPIPVIEPEAPAVPATTSEPWSPRDHLRNELRTLIENTSGSSLGDGESMPFLDAGLDSLLLTQLAFTLQRKYRVNLNFRQLLDGLSSLGPLTDYILKQQHPEPPATPVVPELPAPAKERGTPKIPLTGARLGRDANGNPAWFVADPERDGKYLRVEIK